MKAIRMLKMSIRDSFKSVIRNYKLSLASISCITITLIIVAIAKDKPQISKNANPENNNKINNDNEQKEDPKEQPKDKTNDESKISLKNQKTIKKIKEICSQDFISIEELRNICWKGIPSDDPLIRAECWKILLGLYPLKKELKVSIIKRKKDEYIDMCNLYSNALSNPDEVMNEEELKIYRQIQKDNPRTMPESSLFQHEKIQFMLTRVLYIWSLRHPASGYVQGFNDLCIPFFIVYFLEKFPEKNVDTILKLNENEFKKLSEETLTEIETTIYFSLTKLLDRIQTNYTINQPGITLMIKKMELIIEKVDPKLYDYLKKFEIDYVQFCFRWMNCFLIREFPVKLILRLWDAYFSEEKGFSEFHLYVCACLLLTFSEKLKAMTEFQELIVFLQNLPTSNWRIEDMDMLLAKSYSIKMLYSNSIILKNEGKNQ